MQSHYCSVANAQHINLKKTTGSRSLSRSVDQLTNQSIIIDHIVFYTTPCCRRIRVQRSRSSTSCMCFVAYRCLHGAASTSLPDSSQTWIHGAVFVPPARLYCWSHQYPSFHSRRPSACRSDRTRSLRHAVGTVCHRLFIVTPRQC